MALTEFSGELDQPVLKEFSGDLDPIPPVKLKEFSGDLDAPDVVKVSSVIPPKPDNPRGIFGAFVDTMGKVGDVITGRAGRRATLEHEAGAGVFGKNDSDWELQQRIDAGSGLPQQPPSMTAGPANPQTFSTNLPLNMDSRPGEVVSAVGNVLKGGAQSAGALTRQSERGVRRFIADAQGAGESGVNPIADQYGADARFAGKAADNALANLPENQKWFAQQAANAMQNIATAAPAALIPSAGPLAGAAKLTASMFVPQAGAAYTDLRDKGFGLDAATAGAVMQGASEAVPEAIGMNWLIGEAKKLPGFAASLVKGDIKAAEEIAKFYGKGQIAELLQEYPSTAGNFAGDYLMGDKTATRDRFINDMIETTKSVPIQGGIQSAAMHAVGKGQQAVSDTYNNIRDRMDPQGSVARELESAVGDARAVRAGDSEIVRLMQPPALRFDRSSPAPGSTMAPTLAQVSQSPAQEVRNESMTSEPPGPERMPGGMPVGAMQVTNADVRETWNAGAAGSKIDLNGLKGSRDKAEIADLSPEEKVVLTNASTAHGLDGGEAIAEAAKIKTNYPADQGWDHPVVSGIAPTGKTINDRLTFKTIPYSFSQAPSGVSKQQWSDEVAKRMTNEMLALTKRAKTDPVAAGIIGHMTWYREMARRLRQEFGGFGDVFADLLGATSPNTPVRTNWNFSVDILRRFSRGEFDADLAALEKHLNAGGGMQEFAKVGPLITQITGKKYGMNSGGSMKALLGLWRAVRAGDAPKAKNFAMNLIGQSDKATIDVWAARMLQRLAGGKRIPPPAEGAVAGNHLVNPEQVGGAFGFGQAVFEKVAQALRAKGIDVTAPDLQAVAWFMEKEIWTKNGWTKGLGSEGSFENEADKMPMDRYQVGATVAQYEHTPTDPEMVQASNDFTQSVKGDPAVVAYRSLPTVGMYAGDSERSFDTEVIAASGWDPAPLMSDVAKVAKAAGQYDAFVSRVLDAKEKNGNWRPGIEVYFKSQQAADAAERVIAEITKNGIDGFTLIKDPREGRAMSGADSGQYIGLRLQYIPEIFMRWVDQNDPKQKAELDILLSGDHTAISALMQSKEAAMQDAVLTVAAMGDVAYTSVSHYDTTVMGKENYDDYIQVAEGVNRPASSKRSSRGQRHAEVFRDAAIRLGLEAAGQVGPEPVSSRGSDSEGLPAGMTARPMGVSEARTMDVRGQSYSIDAPNFSFPPNPITLPDGHPLLTPTMSEDGKSAFPKDYVRGDGKTTEQLHVSIVNSHFDGKKPVTGRKPKLILMAGGGGAGKGHVKKLLVKDGLLPQGAVDLDPDAIKTEMIPEFAQIAAAGDSRGAAVTHEESSVLSKAIFKRAMDGGHDIIFDRTMAELEKGLKLMEDAVAAGYEVEMHAVMIDARMAAVQAMDRAQHTYRYVPSSAFLKAHKGIAAYLDTYIESGLLSNAVVWDNRAATIPIATLDASGYNIHDIEAYRDMVDRGADISVEADTLGEIYGNAREESGASDFAWSKTQAAMVGSRDRGSAERGRGQRGLGSESGGAARQGDEQEGGLPVSQQQQAGASFAYAGMPVTSGSAGLTQQYSPKLSEQAMSRRNLQPLEPEQKQVIDAAIADVVATGRVPMSWAKGVTFYGLKPMASGYANYDPRDSSVGVKFFSIDEAGRGNKEVARDIRGWIAHELHHSIDTYRVAGDRMFAMSEESPRMAMSLNADGNFDGTGDLAGEALGVWYGSDAPADLQSFLSYPMIQAEKMARDGHEEDAAAFAKTELFAQMGALYAATPDAMEKHLPKWFGFFKEWNDARGDGSIERSRVALRGLFQKPVPDSGNPGRERGAGVSARSLEAGGAGSDVRPGGPRVGEASSNGRDGRASPVLPATVPATGRQEALKALWGNVPSRRASVPANNHIPTHVNYSTFDDAKGLHTMYATMSRDFEKQIQQQRRGSVAIEQSYREARDLISDEAGISQEQIDKMLGRKAGTAAGAAEILARMAILESATAEVDRMANDLSGKGALQISEKDAIEFAAALDRAAMAHATFLGARAEIGRAMNAIRNFRGMPYDEAAVHNVLRTFSGKEGLAKVAEAIAGSSGLGGHGSTAVSGFRRGGSGGRAAAIGRLATAASKPTILDAAIEAWKAGLLSAPPTHLANILGNTVFTLMRVPTAAVAGMVGAISMQHDRARMGEVLAMMVGGLHGGAMGLRAAYNNILDEDATLGPTPTEERQHAISGQTFGAKGKLGTMIDYVGKGVRTTFRALSAEDSFFKAVNMYMTLYAEATRTALMEGGKYWQGGFSRRVAELINEGSRHMLDPTGAMGPYPLSQKGMAIGDKAIQDGLKYTFQEKLGNIGSWIESGRHAVPALHFVIPFVRTPTNIFRITLEHTPFAPMSKQFREEIKAGGARMNTALSQVMVGSMLGAAAYMAAAAGLLTGGGDPEKEARKRRRELDIPDYAIKINGKWYEFRRMEPLGTLLGMAADAAEVSKYMTKEENEHVAMMISLAFSQAVLNKTYMRGLNDLLNVMTDPERYGATWEQSMAGTLVPSGVAFLGQEQDPWVRDAKVRGDMPAMEKFVATVTNGIKARLPKTDLNPEFNRQSLPVAIDSWGQPRKQDEKAFTGAPMKAMTESQDPVRQEAFRLRVKGSDVGDKVQGVKVDSRQYETISKTGGQLAHQILSGIVTAPGFSEMKDAYKVMVYNEVLHEARQYGRDIITPELIDKIIAKQLKKGGIDERD